MLTVTIDNTIRGDLSDSLHKEETPGTSTARAFLVLLVLAEGAFTSVPSVISVPICFRSGGLNFFTQNPSRK